MSRRTPLGPPQLPGFEFVEGIGTGGYADVFLYQQLMPRRQVAVKVLDPSTLPPGTDQSTFTDEANVMAMVSAHPYIVQVFHADIAPDGRPYLVMEYYPGPNFASRARAEHLDVAEVLRVGVQLASAVETAHLASILHRDIKPANVLTSAYRRPGLTDFGIAATAGPQSAADALSVPWAPPEAFGGHGDQRADIYSLAATVYSMLAGRSPFEIPGGDNGQLALVARIERSPVPSIGRSDVPPSLERVLAAAMAKDPARRPSSAADFGRQLQAVESELHFAVTPLELEDNGRNVRLRADEVDEDSTRIKGIAEVQAQSAPFVSGPSGSTGWASGPSQPAASISNVPANPVGGGTPVAQRRREGLLDTPEVESTVYRSPSAAPAPSFPQPKRANKVAIGAGIAAALLGVIIAAALVLGGGGDAENGGRDNTEDPVEVNDNIPLPVAVGPSAPESLAGVPNGDGTFTFTWQSPGPEFSYAVSIDEGASSEEVLEASFTTTAECIEVEVIAENGLISNPTSACALP